VWLCRWYARIDTDVSKIVSKKSPRLEIGWFAKRTHRRRTSVRGQFENTDAHEQRVCFNKTRLMPRTESNNNNTITDKVINYSPLSKCSGFIYNVHGVGRVQLFISYTHVHCGCTRRSFTFFYVFSNLRVYKRRARSF